MPQNIFTIIKNINRSFELTINKNLPNKNFNLVINPIRSFEIIVPGFAQVVGSFIKIKISKVLINAVASTISSVFTLSLIINKIKITFLSNGLTLRTIFYQNITISKIFLSGSIRLIESFNETINNGKIVINLIMRIIDDNWDTNIRLNGITTVFSPIYVRYILLSYYDNWWLSDMDGHYLSSLGYSEVGAESKAGYAMGVLGLTYSENPIPTDRTGQAMGVLGLTYTD